MINRSFEKSEDDEVHLCQNIFPSIENFTGIEYIQNKSSLFFDIDSDDFDINKLELIECEIYMKEPIVIEDSGWYFGLIIYDNERIKGYDYYSDWKDDEILWEK